ncbi:hypothetical protein BD779DRAFT_1476173 [Infundibulicybe gibba]|nr:hypothetical protein BD779DRAFT_1476173 [Infundibulicybe gibba]
MEWLTIVTESSAVAIVNNLLVSVLAPGAFAGNDIGADPSSQPACRFETIRSPDWETVMAGSTPPTWTSAIPDYTPVMLAVKSLATNPTLVRLKGVVRSTIGGQGALGHCTLLDLVRAQAAMILDEYVELDRYNCIVGMGWVGFLVIKSRRSGLIWVWMDETQEVVRECLKREDHCMKESRSIKDRDARNQECLIVIYLKAPWVDPKDELLIILFTSGLFLCLDEHMFSNLFSSQSPRRKIGVMLPNPNVLTILKALTTSVSSPETNVTMGDSRSPKRPVPGQFTSESLMSMDSLPSSDKPAGPRLVARRKYDGATVANPMTSVQAPNVGVKSIATLPSPKSQVGIKLSQLSLVSDQEPQQTVIMVDVDRSYSTTTKRGRPEDDKHSESEGEDMAGIDDSRLPKVRLVQPQDLRTLASNLADREVEINTLRMSLDMMSTQKKSVEDSLSAISAKFEEIENSRLGGLPASEDPQMSFCQKLGKLHEHILGLEKANGSAYDVGKTEGWNEGLKHATQLQEVIKAEEQTNSADVATQTIFPRDEDQLDSSVEIGLACTEETDDDQACLARLEQEHETLVRTVAGLTKEQDRLEDALVQHEITLQEEKDNHSVTKQDLEMHRQGQNKLHQTVSGLERERDELTKLKGTTEGERDKFMRLKETAEGERDKLLKLKEMAEGERVYHFLMTTQDKFMRLKETVEGERDELLEFKEAAAKLRHLLQTHESCLQKERTEHERGLEEHRQEQERLRQTVLKLEGERETLSKFKETVEREWEALLKFKETATRLQESHQEHKAERHAHVVLAQTLEKERNDHLVAIKNAAGREKILQQTGEELHGRIIAEKEAHAATENALKDKNQALQQVTEKYGDMEQANDALRQKLSVQAESGSKIQRLVDKVQELETERVIRHFLHRLKLSPNVSINQETYQAGLAAAKEHNASLQKTNQERDGSILEADQKLKFVERVLAENHLQHSRELDQKNREYQAQLDDKDTQLTDLKQQLNALKQNPQAEGLSRQDEDIDIDMGPLLTDKGKGKRPETVLLPRLAVEKTMEKRNPRPRTDESVGMFRQRDYDPEVIAPPMKFARPYGACTSLSERFRDITPAANTARAMTPTYRSGRNVSRGPTPGPSRAGPSRFRTPFENTLPRDMSSRQASPPTPAQKDTPSPSSTDTLPPSDPPLPVTVVATGLTTSDAILNNVVLELRSIGERIISAVGNHPSPARSKLKPHGEFKTPSPRKPRTVARGKMMSAVRLEMNSLLGIRIDADIFTVVEGTLVHQDEVQDYLDGNIAPPLLQPLRIFWDQINHPWNGHIAQEFTRHFIQEEPDFAGDEAQIEAHFTQRLGTLRKILMDHIPRDGERTAEEVSQRVADRYQATCHNKRVRKRQQDLFELRRNICTSGTERLDGFAHGWQLLHNLVDSLGVDGTSSDESDDEDYAVKIKPWRSTEVRDMLIYIDNNRTTRNALGNKIPGGRPRERVRKSHAPVSMDSAVPCLAMNFYDKAWYDSLTERQRFDLAAAAAASLPELA